MITIDMGPMPPRSWFICDWRSACRAWIESGKTEEEFFALDWRERARLAEAECDARRARGEADPEPKGGLFP